MTEMPAIRLADVHKNFGATEIIRGVSLDVAGGERHAIIGPNGAGKTTLFNLISGRFPITAGSIELHGQRIDALPPQRINRLGLSRSFQITSIFPRLTVFENLRCALLWSRSFGICAHVSKLRGKLESCRRCTDEKLLTYDCSRAPSL